MLDRPIVHPTSKMFLLGVLCTLLVTASAEFCYNDVVAACSPQFSSRLIDGPTLPNCNAKYGGIGALEADLQAYANDHIETSFEFLLMSTYFGNYESNREGFKGLYRKLSNNAWQKSIDMIKYITERGGRMNFNQLPHFKKNSKGSRILDMSELHSLAKALDLTKQLANQTLRMYVNAHRFKDGLGDYLAKEFVEPQSRTIRALVGHTTELKSLLNRDAPLNLFLFDEYLKTTL